MTQTKTVTRETVEVQTKEETLYVCANCEQAFEDDETVTVAVDVDDDGHYATESTLCKQCSDTLLGSDGGHRAHYGLSKIPTVPEKVKEAVNTEDAIAVALCWVATFGLAHLGFVAPALLWGLFGLYITAGALADTALRWADQ